MLVSRLKNIGLLTIALFRFFVFGKANKSVGAPRKILIIHLGKLGDMVCATPMFQAVKEKYPQSKLYVMGNILNGELLRGNPNIDNYFIYSDNFRELFKIFKKEKFDFACMTGSNFLALAALFLAGTPLISAPVVKDGFSPYETRPYKILRNFVITKPHHMGNYAPREYLRLLEPIDIFSDNTKKYLYFSETAEKSVKKFLLQNNINLDSDFVVGITPSAGNKIKEWGRNKFAKLADYISDKYQAKIIIIGGPNDTEVDEMISFIDKGTKFINARGLFSVEELKALISKLNLFISVDTGPIYIAEAFGVPTIDIIGPMDENEQPPAGKFHKIIVAKRLKPALHIMNARVYDAKEAKRQVDEITAEMVIRELDDLIQEIKISKPKWQIKTKSLLRPLTAVF